MSRRSLDRLHHATQAIYLRELQKVQGTLRDEKILRGKLSQLDDLKNSEGHNSAESHTMQVVGADILWRGWLERTRRQLNMELAHVLARKIEQMDYVHRAFGRQLAVEGMVEEELSKRAAKLRRKTELLPRTAGLR